MTRTPGEAVYAGSLSPQQRAARQLGKDMREMMDAIVRREEWMAAYWSLFGPRQRQSHRQPSPYAKVRIVHASKAKMSEKSEFTRE
ncbi:MAG: Phage major capsid protein E [Candidatus Kentron sp. G]|nr:MAG: Phage major capsid protein E [Candidatus Kentron sp. G]